MCMYVRSVPLEVAIIYLLFLLFGRAMNPGQFIATKDSSGVSKEGGICGEHLEHTLNLERLRVA